jgi:hypothetical protein
MYLARRIPNDRRSSDYSLQGVEFGEIVIQDAGPRNAVIYLD